MSTDVPPKPSLPSWLREPALHFLVLGALLFGAHALLRGPAATRSSDPRRIVVTRAYIDGLLQEFEKRTGTPRGPDDDRGLAAQFIDEEILYREALALGLDREDTIVRRRLIQKMGFLSEDLTPLAEPTDAELEAFLEAHAVDFMQPAFVGFTHVFLSRERRGEAALADARAVHEALLRSPGPAADAVKLGDPFLEGSQFGWRSEKDLAGSFGEGFAKQVFTLPTGSWSEPIASTFGFHLVHVEQRREARRPALAEVRAQVRDQLLRARRKEVNSEMLARLRAKYEIVVEPGVPL